MLQDPIPAPLPRERFSPSAACEHRSRKQAEGVPPSNRLEQLRGDRDGQWSLRINNQWRICFRWEEHDAYDVEVTDSH
ncbi:hypothetical protein CKO25_09110 [Thiocapsa imhoffii]|uniref:Type II toxin-antitoxin system RelE/ParE family toxin n=1 Tax=Thiocapsa imhoffii TaxID=382777 RepID=A0A9X0WHH9_9GAMM|nr:hypothetical protein [Thiocapsa imhoffii]